MSYSVRLSESAVNDLISITEYIAQDSPSRAESFVNELRERSVRKLSIFPFPGVAVAALRYMTLGSYVVVYSVDEVTRTVMIVMVSEGHRDRRRILDV